MKVFSIGAAMACLIMAAAPTVASAHDHPAYLHALSDLRDARAHLEHRTGDSHKNWDEGKAIHEIDEAIREIKEAAIWDNKDINDHVKIDLKFEWGGRLRKANELLHKAEHDVMEDQDRGFARGMQERAIHHIHEAIRHTEEGMRN